LSPTLWKNNATVRDLGFTTKYAKLYDMGLLLSFGNKTMSLESKATTWYILDEICTPDSGIFSTLKQAKLNELKFMKLINYNCNDL